MPATFGVVLFMIVVSFIILAAIEMKSRRQAKSAPETQESQPPGHDRLRVEKCGTGHCWNVIQHWPRTAAIQFPYIYLRPPPTARLYFSSEFRACADIASGFHRLF